MKIEIKRINTRSKKNINEFPNKIKSETKGLQMVGISCTMHSNRHDDIHENITYSPLSGKVHYLDL
jgi:hypothetical protein